MRPMKACLNSSMLAEACAVELMMACTVASVLRTRWCSSRTSSACCSSARLRSVMSTSMLTAPMVRPAVVVQRRRIRDERNQGPVRPLGDRFHAADRPVLPERHRHRALVVRQRRPVGPVQLPRAAPLARPEDRTMAPQRGSGFVEIGDASGDIGGVDGCRERVQQATEPTLALLLRVAVAPSAHEAVRLPMAVAACFGPLDEARHHAIELGFQDVKLGLVHCGRVYFPGGAARAGKLQPPRMAKTKRDARAIVPCAVQQFLRPRCLAPAERLRGGISARANCV